MEYCGIIKYQRERGREKKKNEKKRRVLLCTVFKYQQFAERANKTNKTIITKTNKNNKINKNQTTTKLQRDKIGTKRQQRSSRKSFYQRYN